MIRQLAIEAETARLLRAANTAERRIQAANEARQAGKTRIAANLYVSVAGNRTAPKEHRDAARSALSEMQTEARQHREEIEGRLAASVGSAQNDEVSPSLQAVLLAVQEGRRKLGDTPGAKETTVAERHGEVLAAFAELKKLARDYAGVPVVNRELQSAVGRARRNPRCAAALDEPKAAEFWRLAQQHEKAGEACCAVLAYAEAAKLAPAPSAVRAENRWKTLNQDPQIAQAAKHCLQLQQCHRLYQRAERLVKVGGREERARELFQQVVSQSPTESAVHTAAREQLAQLRTSKG